MLPTLLSPRSEIRTLEGSEISVRPSFVISKTPISFVEPNRFLIDLSNLHELIGSPSICNTTSTICSKILGPAILPSFVTCPEIITGTSLVLAHSSKIRVHSRI